MLLKDFLFNSVGSDVRLGQKFFETEKNKNKKIVEKLSSSDSLDFCCPTNWTSSKYTGRPRIVRVYKIILSNIFSYHSSEIRGLRST